MNARKRVLVTGGAGFLGWHLAGEVLGSGPTIGLEEGLKRTILYFDRLLGTS